MLTDDYNHITHCIRYCIYMGIWKLLQYIYIYIYIATTSIKGQTVIEEIQPLIVMRSLLICKAFGDRSRYPRNCIPWNTVEHNYLTMSEIVTSGTKVLIYAFIYVWPGVRVSQPSTYFACATANVYFYSSKILVFIVNYCGMKYTTKEKHHDFVRLNVQNDKITDMHES